jgi:lipopolysaccharide transport system permease protein
MLARSAPLSDLAWRLANRDISAQYRGLLPELSVGLHHPLVNHAMWVFMSMAGVVKVAVPICPIPCSCSQVPCSGRSSLSDHHAPQNQVTASRAWW